MPTMAVVWHAALPEQCPVYTAPGSRVGLQLSRKTKQPGGPPGDPWVVILQLSPSAVVPPALTGEFLGGSFLPSLQPVRGGFARLQRGLAELRAFSTEGAFQPKEDAVAQAVKDGLQQFKQFTRQGAAGASFRSSSLEITVLTGQVGTEVVTQLEAGLQGISLVSLHQLQVVVIGRDPLPDPSGAEGLSRARGEAGCIENSLLLGTAVDLQAVENDLVALETFFKGWLQDSGTDQEHLHLLLPPCAGGAGPVCVKCDVHERLLSPTLLPAACSSSNIPGSADDATGPFGMAAAHSLAPCRLRVVRALKAEGLCASVLFGLPLIVRPTNCWRLNWDELEANQHSFQALCRCLWERGWVLLAQCEARETGPRWGPSADSYQVLQPSDSASLLLRPVAVRELLLPCGFPLLPDDLPAAALSRMESILEGLQVELAYNPLSMTSHLYGVLRSSLGRPPASRPRRAAERPLPRQQSSRQQQSKARAAVAPLRMAPPPASPGPPSLCSGEEDDFLESP